MTVQPIGPSQPVDQVIADALASIRPGLDCTATTEDIWSAAMFVAPEESRLRSMPGRCAIRIEGFGGFSIATVASYTPSSRPSIDIPRYHVHSVEDGPPGTASPREIAVWWISVRQRQTKIEQFQGIDDRFGLKGKAPVMTFVNGKWVVGALQACGGMTVPQFGWLAACG